ncbi:MAG: flagellar protein FlaG [Pseudodesulfovibrio sp.]|jgi:flagellar protein FlaG|uniref:Flagellar biosynthesis protein FlaG n=1 Tax=Pseudodesulfovibrio indicus TaxID=1716143 RepID=A0A126QPB0_9BACT|nr:flagellar protein FlaG [Pseudodesulfovibrio indicus]AMK11832.1 flagellar biosynthesis protein FlaG [Pseudodesulfovibrio indicus]TDT88374.1 flagellar protein FlaG [Pseudodesulfovibrio indicus]
MNIPEMNIDVKQGLHSESAAQAKAVQRPPAHDDPGRDDSLMARKDVKGNEIGPTREELETIIAEAEQALDSNDVKLKFNVLENNDTIQVEVIDSNGKTIRKIPEDDLIKLTKSLKNLGQGFLDEVL